MTMDIDTFLAEAKKVSGDEWEPKTYARAEIDFTNQTFKACDMNGNQISVEGCELKQKYLSQDEKVFNNLTA